MLLRAVTVGRKTTFDIRTWIGDDQNPDLRHKPAAVRVAEPDGAQPSPRIFSHTTDLVCGNAGFVEGYTSDMTRSEDTLLIEGFVP